MSSYSRFEEPEKAIYAAFDDGWKRLRDDQTEPYYLLLADVNMNKWLLKASQTPTEIYVNSFIKSNKRGTSYNFYIIASGNDLRKFYMQLGDQMYHEILELPVAPTPPPKHTLPSNPRIINEGGNKKSKTKKSKTRKRNLKLYKK